MIRVLVFGGYRNRQPLGYAPVRARLRDRLLLVDDPSEAQILLIAHGRDLQMFGAEIHAMLTRWPRLRLVLLSEEPFWDSVWMPDPLTRQQICLTPAGPVACVVLNHHTSAIFRADRVPYFLLTDPQFADRYRGMFARNAGLDAAGWQRQFATAPLDAVFMAERRADPRFARALPGQEMFGLSVWRSELALACRGRAVLRSGRGWTEGPRRQDLPDWHADKLDRLDLQARYIAAFENTHQAEYVSEKIFDAFALGAVPLYLAAPGHAVLRLLGDGGWLNFFGHFREVPDFDATAPVDHTLAADYAAQQERLALLFDDPRILDAEYDRLARTLTEELSLALAAG